MYYKNLKINGVEYPLAVNITGVGAPTSDIEASVGMFYMDENDGKVYKLTPNGWELFGGDAPAFDYGTDDLTPGVSELETGKLYFVYG